MYLLTSFILFSSYFSDSGILYKSFLHPKEIYISRIKFHILVCFFFVISRLYEYSTGSRTIFFSLFLTLSPHHILLTLFCASPRVSKNFRLKLSQRSFFGISWFDFLCACSLFSNRLSQYTFYEAHKRADQPWW